MRKRSPPRAALQEAGESGVTMETLATVMLCVVGWGWSIRAGIKLASYGQSGSSFAKRVAIGNTAVSLLPFALVIFINWPHSN
jgi:hypothetical protein